MPSCRFSGVLPNRRVFGVCLVAVLLPLQQLRLMGMHIGVGVVRQPFAINDAGEYRATRHAWLRRGITHMVPFLGTLRHAT